MTEPLIVEPVPHLVFPELDDLEPLFSDQEDIHPEAPSKIMIPPPSGTSAPLLSNSSLTDTLSNFPLFSLRTGNSSGPEPLIGAEQPQEAERESETQNPNPNHFPALPNTSNRRGRPRGRSPNRRRNHTTSSSKTRASSRGPTARPRRGPRTRVSTRAPPRTLDRARTLPEISEDLSPDQPGTEKGIFSQAPCYQLRANRAPRYRCGTCGSRNCSCVQLMANEPPNHPHP